MVWHVRCSTGMTQKNHVMAEKWKVVPGFPDYEVSTLGRLRSIRRRRGVKLRVAKGWVVRKPGYPMAIKVGLRRDGRTFEFRLHRLILMTFVGPCPKGMEACHNDGNPLNNRLENLRWDTHSANMQDCIRHGKKRKPPVHYGERHPNTVLTTADVKAIRSTPIVHGARIRLARIFGVSLPTICRILRREVWRHV